MCIGDLESVVQVPVVREVLIQQAGAARLARKYAIAW